jgi:hypothetical protein
MNDEKNSIKMSPLTLGGHNFLTSSPFLPIFSAIDAPRGRLHLLLGHHKQLGPLIKMASKPYLKCSVISFLP